MCASSAQAGRRAPAYRVPGDKGQASVSALSPPASSGLNRYQRDRVSRFSAGAVASLDTVRLIAFQVQFVDTLMGGQPGSTRTPRDSTWFGNELQHLEQYYRGASRGRLTVRWTLPDTLYSLPHRMSYYGADATEDDRVVELAQEVIDLADDSVDFAAYDHVFIIHAGAGQETDIAGDSPNQIWSSFYDQSDIQSALDDPGDPGLATNDVAGGSPFFVDNFSVVPSDASQDYYTVGTLGVWAFELGNRIGLLPMFDSTPAGAADSQGVGSFCLMAYGLFNVNGFVPAFPCEFNRLIAGWIDPVLVDASAAPATISLADINTGGPADTVCLRVPITENEYYLVANRVHDANFDSLFTFGDADSNLIPANDESLEGAEFDFFLTDLTNPASERYDPDYGFKVTRRQTGSGIYIWHIDEAVVRDAVGQGYLPDDYVARKGVDLEEADGVQDLDRGGPALFALGSFFDSYRAANDARTLFGPDTKPSSRSNSGAATGIVIETLSAPGPAMTVVVRRDVAYQEARARWGASSPAQPPTVVDLDASGTAEIVALSDDAGVYVFTPGGVEWNDPDSNPATIAPFIAVPGVSWAGAPAFADLDGAAGVELVASGSGGDVFAWKSNGSELVDGDANPATTGILFHGLPMAAPPILVDVNGGAPEVAIVEHDGTNLRVRFVDASGAVVNPATPSVAGMWPYSTAGAIAAPLAIAEVSDGAAHTRGVVLACVDTLAARVRVAWVPFSVSGAAPGAPRAWEEDIVVPAGYDPASFVPTAPAVGDMDGDDDDEIVVALPDGGVLAFEFSSAFSGPVTRADGRLRAPHPSAPALGDVDGDGTLEIAIWDDQYLYLLKANVRPVIEWPRVIRPESAGDQPPLASARSNESPLVTDIDGDGVADVLFPLDDGTLAAFGAAGGAIAGFPRVGPAEAGGAPTLAETSAGARRLVVLGSPGRLRGIDVVTDTLDVSPETALSIQSVAGAPQVEYWTMARADLTRSGRVTLASAVAPASSTFDPESFIIYPNPVTGDVVHARITTNARATAVVSVYTIEGQEAVSESFDVNPNGVVNMPLDEAIDVHTLKSGVYILRIRIESDSGSGSVVKPFAIRR